MIQICYQNVVTSVLILVGELMRMLETENALGISTHWFMIVFACAHKFFFASNGFFTKHRIHIYFSIPQMVLYVVISLNRLNRYFTLFANSIKVAQYTITSQDHIDLHASSFFTLQLVVESRH